MSDSMMQVLEWTGPGQMRIQDAPKPTPNLGQILVQVDAVGVCGSLYGRIHQPLPASGPGT